jgi:hypothetical protein
LERIGLIAGEIYSRSSRNEKGFFSFAGEKLEKWGDRRSRETDETAH